MEILTYMFSLNETLFSIGTYAVSPLEAWATITGLASVILARKNLVSNFYIGLINCVGFGALFFQIQLYSDMLLQLYFISMSLWGIHVWSKKDVANDNVVNVRWMRGNEWQMVLMIVALGTMVLGYAINDLFSFIGSNVALVLGVEYVHYPAELPYRDAFTTVASIVAFALMANRYVESWILWITVNIVCISNYYSQGVFVMTFEYLIFLGNAVWGLTTWVGIARDEHRSFGHV